jgi:RNA recognition motif-containing protein
MRQDKYRGNVFVANLPNGFTDGDLASLFDDYGLVLSAFLARDGATGETKTHGLVSIAPQEAAVRAIAALNGTKIGSRKLEVRQADPTMALSVPGRLRARPHRAAPASTGGLAPHRAAAGGAPAVPRRAFVVEHVTARRLTRGQ